MSGTFNDYRVALSCLDDYTSERGTDEQIEVLRIYGLGHSNNQDRARK